MFYLFPTRDDSLTSVVEGANGVGMQGGNVVASPLEGCKPAARTECPAGAEEWMVERWYSGLIMHHVHDPCDLESMGDQVCLH